MLSRAKNRLTTLMGRPRLLIGLGLATLAWSAVFCLVVWEMRPLSVRSEEEQQTFWRESERIMFQTDVPYREKSAQLLDLGYGINGWLIAAHAHPYFVALNLASLLVGLSLTGYGTMRLARERQARVHQPPG